ncbi:MAG: thiamine-phosphate kinase [Thermoplasmata archaeon]|nr:thiamine-phosphate kinase [Thermoplasmata archaeon]
MTIIGDLGEKAAISRLLETFDPDGNSGIGDDCALVDMGREYLLATCDMVNQETHIPEGTRGWLVGWYVTAINLSDIASMGGFPLGLLFAMGLPKDMDAEYLDDIARGMEDCCQAYGARVLGGDTKENPTITITGTAFGLVGKKDVMLRKGARPGDIVFLTGQLGNQLGWYKSGAEQDIESLLKVEPRIREGQILSQSGAVTSCIDLSDGLSTSIHHLRKASDAGFELEMEKIPFISGLSDEDKERCLHLGGEFELLFTSDPSKAQGLMASGLGGLKLTAIGRVMDDSTVHIVVDNNSQALEDMGYEHFRER